MCGATTKLGSECKVPRPCRHHGSSPTQKRMIRPVSYGASARAKFKEENSTGSAIDNFQAGVTLGVISYEISRGASDTQLKLAEESLAESGYSVPSDALRDALSESMRGLGLDTLEQCTGVPWTAEMWRDDWRYVGRPEPETDWNTRFEHLTA